MPDLESETGTIFPPGRKLAWSPAEALYSDSLAVLRYIAKNRGPARVLLRHEIKVALDAETALPALSSDDQLRPPIGRLSN